MCGEAISRPCARCGAWNPMNYRYCGICGTPFSSEVVYLPTASTEQEKRSLRQLEGDRRIATVLMADVHNSTEILEKVGSETWVEIMNYVLQLMEQEIQRFGGIVDSFRGDGLLAFFGSQQAHEDDPERGVLAGLAIQSSLTAYSDSVADQQEIELRIRIGINTGELIRTSMGDGPQRQLDTGMGEAITIAARMETSAEPGTVLVSANTYRLVEPLFEWLPLGEIPVKGLSYPTQAYRPLSRLTRENESNDTPLQPMAPLHRAAEAEQLFEQVDRLLEGHGRIVLLSGQKGMGKTYLLRYIRNYFNGKLPQIFTWITGYCRSFEQNQPYSVWIDLLNRWLQNEPDESVEAQRHRLHIKLDEMESITWTYPYLAILLSLPLEDEYSDWLNGLPSDELKQHIFHAIQHWVEALSLQKPLLLAFAYIQWIDETSLELLNLCLSSIRHLPITFLFTSHDEQDEHIELFIKTLKTNYKDVFVSIELGPFDSEQSRALIESLLGKDVLHKNTLDLVIQQSEGNPYYITELINQMIDSGILEFDEQTDQWQQTRSITSLDLPDSLQGLLLARLDRLSNRDRQILQAAAVIGNVFWEGVLTRLFDDPKLVKNALQSLEQNEYIHTRNAYHELGTEYTFTPSLIRDVVYESLLSTQREETHLRVATALDASIPADTMRRYDSLIAYHYRNAEEHQKELLHILLAAEQARQVYANYEAIEYYSRALDILTEMECKVTPDEMRYYALLTQHFDVLNGRRQVLYTIGDMENGRKDARALLPLANTLQDDPSWKIDALMAQPEVTHSESREELGDGLHMAEEALKLSRNIEDRQREMFCLMAVAEKKRLLQQPEWLTLAQSALKISREIGDHIQEANILLTIGKGFGPDNRVEALSYLNQALSVSKKLDDTIIQVDILQLLAFELERQGDYYRQLTECEEKRLELSHAIGWRRTEGHAMMKCGQIRGIYLGDFDGGQDLVEQALNVWQNTSARLFPLLRLAQIKINKGHLAEAQNILQEATYFRDRIAENTGRAGLGLGNAILQIAIGDQDALNKALFEAQQIWQMADDGSVSRQYQIAAACLISHADLKLSEMTEDVEQIKYHQEQALETARAALELYWNFGFVQVAECTSEEVLYRYSQALRANQQPEEAQSFLEGAYTEMMRKHTLIPPSSPYFETYLKIPLHGEIQTAVTKNSRSKTNK